MDEKTFDKCQCDKPGWCELFQKEMGENPPNWRWCNALTPKERKEYYNSINFSIRTIRKAIDDGKVHVINFYDELNEPKSDYAVCVIPANDYAIELLEITGDSIKRYAEKCGADYIELTGDQNPKWPMANKYRLTQVTKKYKKTLYLDCDVLVKDDAPNIFEITPNDKISAYDEYEIFLQKDRVSWIHDQQQAIIHKICNQETKDRLIDNGKLTIKSMINGGVLVIPQELSDYYQQPNTPYFKYWCFDQHYLTIMLPQDKLNKLSYHFNCEYESPDFYVKQKHSHFLHINNLKNEPERRQAILNRLKDGQAVIDDKLLIHEDFSMSTKYHKCKMALANQKKENIKLKEYVASQEKTDYTVDDVCILCLGHSEQQFSTIEDRPYLKKVNLNEIDAGEYSDNIWAETRGYLSKQNLFPESAEFYGFVTASWKMKYENCSDIDSFHNWPSTSILLNSKPEDRVILCADMFCWCGWINDAATSFNCCILNHLLDKDQKSIGRQFAKLMKLDTTIHKRVPFSNQQIYHKSLYFEWRKFLDDNDCLEKTKWFVDRLIRENDNDQNSNLTKKYSTRRLHAYFMEMVNIMWLTNNNFKFIANTTRKDSWYNLQEMSKRVKSW